MDSHRVRALAVLTIREAKKWYIQKVVNVNREQAHWTFEEVIGLYSRFIHDSTMQDEREKFDNVRYSNTRGVQGFHEELLGHAQNMVVYPDDFTILRAFLKGIPEEMRTVLLGAPHYLDPEVHTVNEFLAVAKMVETSKKTARHYNTLSAKGYPSERPKEKKPRDDQDQGRRHERRDDHRDQDHRNQEYNKAGPSRDSKPRVSHQH